MNKGNKGSSIISDLWALEVYLTVCEVGSMTESGQRLGLTQPAVSRVIMLLEKDLGVQLLDRTLRPIGLTAAGGMLRKRAQQLLDEARQIAPAVRQTTNVRFPFIRVGIVESFASIFSPALAQEMKSIASQISIWTGLSPTHGDALLKRSLDMIITSDALDDVDGLERYQLIQEPFILVLPGTHVGKVTSLPNLAHALPLIRHSARSHMGIQIERHLRRLGLEIPRYQEFDSSSTVVAMVTAGLGWAITTPLCLMEAKPPADRVIAASVPPPGFMRRLTLVTRAGELGRVPEQIAELARRVLLERCAPEWRNAMPWLTEMMRVG